MSLWTNEPGVVQFPDGRRIRGTGIRHRRGEIPVPEFAVYLLGRDPSVSEWPYTWVRWRDFSLPDSTDDAIESLREAYSRASHQRVEIACGAGIGRTGTAMALLAIIAGIDPAASVDWVRERYHPHAVETRGQRRWIAEVAGRLG